MLNGVAGNALCVARCIRRDFLHASRGKSTKIEKRNERAMRITNEAARTYILFGDPRGSPIRLTRVIVVVVGRNIAPPPQNAAERIRNKRRVNILIYLTGSLCPLSRVLTARSRTHRRRRVCLSLKSVSVVPCNFYRRFSRIVEQYH